MNKLFLVLAVFSVASVGLSEDSAEQRAAFNLGHDKRMARLGGALFKPGSQQGVIVFVNGQSLVPQSALTNLTVEIAKESRLHIKMISDPEKVTPKNASERKADIKADIAVFLTECEECDTMLLNAPEAGWAIVNVSAVVKGARNEVFKAARLRKEMTRAFYSVAGAMNSQYPGSLMGCVRTPSDLDKLLEDPPLDVYGRVLENLRGMGVSPAIIYTYKRACEEGWAPKPTNEVQQAVWDRVHQKPTKGIEIKYDPKKGI